jgi:hypothetical protein
VLLKKISIVRYFTLGGLPEDIILFGQQAAHCIMALLLMASSNQQQLKCSMKFPENKLTITLGLNEHSSDQMN